LASQGMCTANHSPVSLSRLYLECSYFSSFLLYLHLSYSFPLSFFHSLHISLIPHLTFLPLRIPFSLLCFPPFFSLPSFFYPHHSTLLPPPSLPPSDSPPYYFSLPLLLNSFFFLVPFSTFLSLPILQYSILNIDFLPQ
jgi:hypothetical protein